MLACGQKTQTTLKFIDERETGSQRDGPFKEKDMRNSVGPRSAADSLSDGRVVVRVAAYVQM